MRKLAATLCLTLAVLLAGSLSSVQASDLPKCQGSYEKNTWTNCVGTRTFADGMTYVGEFNDNEFHGQGIATFPPWDDIFAHPSVFVVFLQRKVIGLLGGKYVGEWDDGFWHGQGTLTLSNGATYVGEFRDNEFHEQGTYTHTDGRVLEGIWENGEFISQSKASSDKEEQFVTGNLVKDLRSGKSDVRASSTSGSYQGIIQFWRQMKSKPDFKATVSAKSHGYGAFGESSAEAAVKRAIGNCKEKGGGVGRCKVYAVGDNIVQGRSQAELADAIEAYNLKVSGEKKKDTADDTSSTTAVETEVPSDDAPLEAKLEKLKKLLEKGLITEEEAAAKRAKLLEDL